MRHTLRVVIAASAAVLAWGALAAPKDSVTLGVILEPPGLDPTTGAAAAIGEVTHYNIFEGLTKINADFSVTPLLAESWSLSPDLEDADLQAAQGRSFPGRRPVHLQGREILVRARRRAGFHQ